MNLTDRGFGRLIVAAVSIGFMVLLAVGGFAAWTAARNQTYSAWVGHTYQVEQALADFRNTNERLETARRGYLLDGDERFYSTYLTSVAQLPKTVAHIADLTRDNPNQQRRIQQLAAFLKIRAVSRDLPVAKARAGDHIAALQAFRADQNVAVSQTIRALTAAMVEEEASLLRKRIQDAQHGVNLLVWALAAAGALILLVGGGAVVIILRYTHDLSASRTALMGLNENLEAAVAERTVNLTRANDEIQRFAYIVSHDLRSPLVNVMGFTSELDAAIGPLSRLIEAVEAEAPRLLNEDARAAVREDIPEAVGFIRSSTQKMDRLINAILRLSREGRRAITAEPLDLAAIVTEVAESLKHRTDSLGARIEVDGPLPALHSDRLAMEQILSNLIENAVKYLKPGRPGEIVVRGKQAGGRVTLSVADNGRGIDPRDHERIFDLFRRSGVQDQPGEGIGLAHVRALAYRLGGVIGCESELDRGTIFHLSLPTNLANPQDLS